MQANTTGIGLQYGKLISYVNGCCNREWRRSENSNGEFIIFRRCHGNYYCHVLLVHVIWISGYMSGTQCPSSYKWTEMWNYSPFKHNYRCLCKCLHRPGDKPFAALLQAGYVNRSNCVRIVFLVFIHFIIIKIFPFLPHVWACLENEDQVFHMSRKGQDGK